MDKPDEPKKKTSMFPMLPKPEDPNELRERAQRLTNTMPGLYDTKKKITVPGAKPLEMASAENQSESPRKEFPSLYDNKSKMATLPGKDSRIKIPFPNIVKPGLGVVPGVPGVPGIPVAGAKIQVPLRMPASMPKVEESSKPITTTAFNAAQVKIVTGLNERGVLLATLIPKIGRDKALEIFDLAYKSVLTSLDSSVSTYFQYLSQITRQVQTLMEQVPYSPEAYQLVNRMGGSDIYVYCTNAYENLQRFSEVAYLLYYMGRDHLTISEIVNRNSLKNANIDLFPQQTTRNFRRVSDLFLNVPEQDLAIMSLRDRGIIIASLIPILGAEKVTAYFKSIFKPFLSDSLAGQEGFSGKLRFVNLMMQKLIGLLPYSEDAQRLACQMFGYESYLYFFTANEDQVRLSAALYLLAKMNVTNQPLFKFIPIPRLLNPENPLFPEDEHKLFRRESDIWDNLPRDHRDLFQG